MTETEVEERRMYWHGLWTTVSSQSREYFWVTEEHEHACKKVKEGNLTFPFIFLLFSRQVQACCPSLLLYCCDKMVPKTNWGRKEFPSSLGKSGQELKAGT